MLSGVAEDTGEAEKNGSRIGRYALIEQIGQGGMGSVWRAKQEEPVVREVALKLIRTGMDSGSVVSRFEAERQVLAALDHPNIAKVFEAGTTQSGRPYFVMELIEGSPITDFCESHRLEPRRCLSLFLKVCHAITHAHQKGIIHRDLKPSNILVSGGPDGPEVRVIDFGVAKITGPQDRRETTLLTLDNQVVGTPGYMSPEQAASSDDIDTRSDVYSLGALLYELLTGEPPFSADTLRVAGLEEILRMIREVDPPKPSTRIETSSAEKYSTTSRSLKGDLDWVVMQALAKERERRYATVEALSDDIRRHLNNEVVSAAAPGIGYRISKFIGRHRAAVFATTVTALVIIAGGVVATVQAIRATRAEASEKAARLETQLVLADSYVSLGLLEAEKQEFARSRLYFEEAVQLSQSAPEVALAHRMRAKTFGELAPVPLRAITLPTDQWVVRESHPTRPIVVFEALQGGRDLWVVNVDSQKFIGCERKRDGGFTGVGFDPDSARFASSSAPGKVDLRHLNDGKIIKSFDFSEEVGRIESCCWSSDGKLLFIGAKNARICEVETGELWPDILDHDYGLNQSGKVHTPHILRSTFSPSDNFLVTSGRFNHWTLKLFRLDRQNRKVRTIIDGLVSGHAGIRPPRFVLGESRLVSSTQHHVKVFDPESGDLVTRFPSGGPLPRDISDSLREVFKAQPALQHHVTSKKNVLPDGLHYTSTHPSLIGHLSEGWERPLTSVVGTVMGFLQSEGEALAVTRNLRTVMLWRMKNDDRLWSLPAAASSRPVFSSDGKRVCAAGPNQKDILVYETSTRQPAGKVFTPGGTVHAAAFTPDGKLLACGIEGPHQVAFVDWRTAELSGGVVSFESPPLAICFHPDGSWCAVGCQSGQVFRIDTGTREKKLLIEPKVAHPVNRLLFADGALVAAFVGANVSESHTYVWDLAEERLRFPPLPHRLHGYRRSVDYRDGVLMTPSGPHRFCDIASGEAIHSPLTNSVRNDILRFGHDADSVVHFRRANGARITNWRTGEPVCADLMHGMNPRWAHTTTAIPGTPWVVVCGLNGARFFDVASAKQVAPPIHWPKWDDIWRHPHCEISPDRRTLAFNNVVPGMHMIDLGSLLDDAPNTSSGELDELSAGAWLTGNGFSEIQFDPDWLRRWKAFREANSEAPWLRLEE